VELGVDRGRNLRADAETFHRFVHDHGPSSPRHGLEDGPFVVGRHRPQVDDFDADPSPARRSAADWASTIGLP